MRILKYILTFIFTASVAAYSAQDVTIGVLAHKNYESAKSEWEPTAKYLSEKLPEYRFVVKPLKFGEFETNLKDKKIDFLILNSAYYVDLESKYGISRIATLKTKSSSGKPQTKFGGVVFTKSSNTSVKTLKDLRGRSFAAVDKSSFGGWIMALREIHRVGVKEGSLRVSFLGSHEKVVKAIQNGEFEVGTVRTDILEQMAAENKIKIEDFKIIEKQNLSDFTDLLSTRLYPEWPFAKTKHIDDRLSEKISITLISMPHDSAAAVSSRSFGWTIPLDYGEIHECLKELNMGPYSLIKDEAASYFIKKYLPLISFFGLLLIVFAIAALYVSRANMRLREAKADLKTVNDSLEKIVIEKTSYLTQKSEELEKAYENEKYLRGILQTVAEVNQILITTNSLEDLLEDAAFCISKNKAFKSAKICLVKNGALELGAMSGIEIAREVDDVDVMAFETKQEVLMFASDPNMPQKCKDKMRFYDIRAVYALPLKSSIFTDEIIGILEICTGSLNGFREQEQSMLKELAGDIGFAINSYAQKAQIEALNEEKIRSYQEFIEVIANMIEQRDTYTAGHSERVSDYCGLIADEMGLSPEDKTKLCWAAKLHDVGKIVTPDSVLLKPTSLNGLERGLIEEHVTAGYKALSAVDFYKELADIVVCHHERYDGSGYPYGKKGDEIPLFGHILSVADSFDAMTTNRIYKPRKTKEESFTELKGLSGAWYHPSVVEAALNALQSVNIDPKIDQLGFTPIEEERLSYFFKDRLTKLYNEEYFALTIDGRTRHKTPSSLHVISIVNFTKYNKERSWEGGNELLCEFADFLSANMPNSTLFRMWGDNFIAADFNGDINALLARSPLKTKGLLWRAQKITDLPASLHELRELTKGR